MQRGTSRGFQRAVCTGLESVSETKTREHGQPCQAPALAPAAARTVSAALRSKEGPKAQGQPCTPWPGSVSLPLPPSAEGLPSGSKPNKGRQPEEGAGARPGRVTAPPFPAEWRGPERVNGGAGDTKRPEASPISLLRSL